MYNEDSYYDAQYERYDRDLSERDEIEDHVSYLREIAYALGTLADAMNDYEMSKYKGELFDDFYLDEIRQARRNVEQAARELGSEI